MGFLDIWVHLYVVDMHTRRVLIKGFFLWFLGAHLLVYCEALCGSTSLIHTNTPLMYHTLVSTFIDGLDKDRNRLLIT